MTTFPSTHLLETWHRCILEKNFALLETILADDVQLKSPFYWKPKLGKPLVIKILSTVAGILNPFNYEREWINADHWALEFSAEVAELQLKGIDLIRLNHEGKISEIEVMIRPFTALQKFIEILNERLQTNTP